MLEQAACLKHTLDDVQLDKENLEKDYNSLDKSHKKLVKVLRELQIKHEKICSNLKDFKNENNQISTEYNAISVALVTSRKSMQDHLKLCSQEKGDLKKEIVKLRVFKNEKDAEERKAKKVEKKTRQKNKREILKKQSFEVHTVEGLEATLEIHSTVDSSNNFEILQNQNLCSKPIERKVNHDQIVKIEVENDGNAEEPEETINNLSEPPDLEATSKPENNNEKGISLN